MHSFSSTWLVGFRAGVLKIYSQLFAILENIADLKHRQGSKRLICSFVDEVFLNESMGFIGGMFPINLAACCKVNLMSWQTIS